MQKSIVKSLLLIILLMMLIIGSSTAQTVKKWTFMVFIAGDNDLEPFALNDMQEMIAVGSSDQVNIIVEMDRAAGYDDSWGNWTEARRFYVERADSLDQLQPVERLGEVNTGDPQTLINFLTWGITNYPAENYGLIIWSHGGGWQGIGPDESHSPGMLSLGEISFALETARAQTGIDKFEFVGFDACLMGQLEVFQALQGHARYGFAAEEVIPGNGQDYVAILSQLVGNPDMSTEELLQIVVDSYMIYYAEFGIAYQSYDLHVIDLDALDLVNNALGRFITVANANMTDIFNALGVARVSSQNFSYAQDFEFVDLIDLMDLLIESAESPEVQSAAQQVIGAVAEAIFYSRTTDNMPGANGMSVYFPILANSFTKTPYIDSGIVPLMAEDWVGFLETFHTTASTILRNNNLSITITNVQAVNSYPTVLTPPTIDFETTGTAIIDLQYIALYQTDFGQVIVAQSPLAIYTQDAEGNTRKTYPDGDYESSYTWDVLMSYMDIEGEQTPLLLEYQQLSGQFKAEGIYCWVEYQECTQAAVFFDGLTQEMLTVWVTIDTGVSIVTAQVLPAVGDTFTPALAIINPDGEFERFTLPDTYTFGMIPPSFYYAPAIDGDYNLTLYIRDLAGEFRADNISFSIDNEGLPTDLRGFPEAVSLGVNFAYPITWGESVIQDLGDGNLRYYVGEPNGNFFINLEVFSADSLDDFYADLEGFFTDTVNVLEVFPLDLSAGWQAIGVEYDFEEIGYGYYLLFYENGTGYLFDFYMPNGFDVVADIFDALFDAFESSLTFFPVE